MSRAIPKKLEVNVALLSGEEVAVFGADPHWTARHVFDHCPPPVEGCRIHQALLFGNHDFNGECTLEDLGFLDGDYLTLARKRADLFASGGDDTRTVIWDISELTEGSGKVVHDMQRRKGSIKSVTVSKDGAWLVTTCSSGHATIYDVETGEQLYEFRDGGSPLRSAAFSPDKTLIVTAGTERIAIIYDIMGGEIVKEFVGHVNAINTAVFSYKGEHVLTASADGTCALWCLTAGGDDRVTNVSQQTYGGGQRHCSSAVFAHDDERVLMAADNNVKVFLTFLGWCVATFRGHLGPVTSVQFSSDDVLVLTGSEDTTAILWNRYTGRQTWIFAMFPRYRLGYNEATVEGVCFSKDVGVVMCQTVCKVDRLRAGPIH